MRIWWDAWHSIRPGLRHPHPLADWRSRFATEIAPRQRIVVAESGGAVVGFVAADLVAAELTQIFVDPLCQREGIGARLFAWAQAQMPAGFVLHTLADNADARAFYERHGLVAGTTRVNPINGMVTIEYRWTPPVR